jgi:hypothetical protein
MLPPTNHNFRVPRFAEETRAVSNIEMPLGYFASPHPVLFYFCELCHNMSWERIG